MPSDLKIGFIGFGEAGFEIASGLQAEGLKRLFLYVRKKTERVKTRARQAGASLLESMQAVAEKSDIILSVVSPGVSVAVTRELVKHLKPGSFYIDLTSSHPDDMKTVAALVAPTGAYFVDGAMMGALPVYGHRVLIYVAGSRAAEAARRLNASGMNLKVVGKDPGQASAVKLILSIATKGFGALLLEMFLASHYFDVDESVLEALEQFYQKGLQAYIDRNVGSSAIYAGRRVVEMEASLRLLKHIGVEPIMTAATVARLKWLDSMKLSDFFKGVVPPGYKEVLVAWEALGLFPPKTEREALEE
jgi:3-hydroxyisobutyrate dehydrogenase-like beta-hydroxyacid dehydrogenase